MVLSLVSCLVIPLVNPGVSMKLGDAEVASHAELHENGQWQSTFHHGLRWWQIQILLESDMASWFRR